MGRGNGLGRASGLSCSILMLYEFSLRLFNARGRLIWEMYDSEFILILNALYIPLSTLSDLR